MLDAPHALLLANQDIRKSLFAATGSPQFRPGTAIVNANETWQGPDSLQTRGVLWARAASRQPSVDDTPTVAAHLARARDAIRDLVMIEQKVRKERQYRHETKWLAENRHQYRGKWIALEGENLLAVGATAGEVFSQVSDRAEPPLVIRIDEEQLPFAGW